MDSSFDFVQRNFVDGVFFFSVFALLAYSILILLYRRSWRGLPELELTELTDKPTRFSIVIALRNEEASLATLFDSLNQLNYPVDAFEIILMNDASDDGSEGLIQRFIAESDLDVRYENIDLGKKRAVHAAIQLAKHEYIAMTDADCAIPVNWLRAFHTQLSTSDNDFVAAPVMYRSKGLWESMLQLEFSSLQASTGAAIAQGRAIMSNGANLCFRRSVYTDVYDLSPQTASGEDVFLMLSIKKRSGAKKIGYCKSRDAVVITEGPHNLVDFLVQRMRWTSKSRFYKDRDVILNGLIVLVANLSLLLLFCASLFLGPQFLLAFGFFFLYKLLIDVPFLYQYQRSLGRTRLVALAPLVQLFLLVYIPIVGVFGHFVHVKWKGRRI